MNILNKNLFDFVYRNENFIQIYIYMISFGLN